MFQQVPIVHQIDYHGQILRLETGLLAKQATASVVATLGETTVMANVVVGKPTNMDYFPLQVIYEEKFYASGKIKSSRFIKREGRPSDNAVLTGRMIDRSLRSLFDSNVRNDIQVIITVLSLDETNTPDLVGVLAASSALKIATKDFAGPVSSIRIGLEANTPQKQITEYLKHQINTTDDFNEIKDALIEASRVLDISQEEDKELIRILARSLAAKDAEWARFFSDIYKQTDRYKPEELRTAYQSDYLPIVNPSYHAQQSSVLDLIVSGDGDNIMMLEAGANIISEEEIGICLDIAADELKVLTNFQSDFINLARQNGMLGVDSLHVITPEQKFYTYWEQFRTQLEACSYGHGTKEKRAEAMGAFRTLHFGNIKTLQDIVYNENIETESSLREFLVSHQNAEADSKYQFDLTVAQNLIDLCDGHLDQLSKIQPELEKAMDTAVKNMVHEKILEQEERIDGRKLDEIRPITCQIDVLPRVHGSSLFTRGETQVLNILTLGSMRDAQTIDEMEDFEEVTKRYLHHYNFPSYSVGETGRYTGPGRREIGHGALAEKALLPVLPTESEFPYTMRLVSECLGSNGSTSMASTCGSTLSLLAGGVPIKDVVAGIAMGLVLDFSTGNFKVLTDIQGAEDHHGDMDFKVTGTATGVTAIQLDNKVAGLTPNILKQALIEAKAGRLFIINKMLEAIEAPRSEISTYAPRVLTTTIPSDRIGDVIGPSGKIIKGLIAKYDVDIDIEDNTGKTLIYGKDSQKTQAALNKILQIIKEFEIGEIVAGKIYRIETYGAFVKIMEEGSETGKEGLIHISNLSDKRVNKVEDIVKIGDIVKAKIIEIKDNGQMSLAVVQ